MAHGLQSTTTSQWPRFRTLLESSRQDWVFGLYAVHFLTQSNGSYAHTYQQQALGVFARVVEIELRECVFKPFRVWSATNKELLGHLTTGSDSGLERELTRFLLTDSSLTSGQMSHALSMARAARSKLFDQLQTWVRRLSPGLLEQTANIESFTKMRNEAVHERAPRHGEDAEKLATVILNAIPPPRQNSQPA